MIYSITGKDTGFLIGDLYFPSSLCSKLILSNITFSSSLNGILKGNGINKNLEEFEIHPVSNIKYDNYKIPFFKEITELCTKAAARFNQTNVIGWDVAITDKGPLIVEGNNGPGFDLVQVVLNKGTKYMIEKIDNEIIKSQKK